MLKKLLILTLLVMTVSAVNAAAEEGYIFQLNEDVVLENSVTEGIENVLASEAIYKADSLEDVYKFADKSEIKHIGRDARVYLFDDDDTFKEPNDPFYQDPRGFQWNIPKINMLSVWEKGYRGQHSTIGIIDSGLYMEHEDIDKTKVISTYNVFDDTDDVSDYLGHGTFVTGIMSAKINNKKGIAGIADKADIAVIKAFDKGKDTTVSVLIKALDKLAETDGIDVVNLSLGVKDSKQSSETEGFSNINLLQSDNSSDEPLDRGTLEMLSDAIDKVVDEGIIVVAAVGNDGNNVLSYPAAFENVIGVGAVDENKNKCDFSQMNESVFVTAPGGRHHTKKISGYDDEDGFVISLSNEDASGVGGSDGTSFAAPHVSAVAAIAKSIYPDLTTEQFKEILKNTSEDLGDEGYDTYYGWGLIDADKVITAAEALAEAAPTPKPSPSIEPSPSIDPSPSPTAGPTEKPEATLNPGIYRKLSYENGKAIVETDDREAVVYAAKFDGMTLKSVEMIKIEDLPANDNGSYEITLSDVPVPTKLFLWHGMTSYISSWVDENYVIPTAEPTVNPTAEPTQAPYPYAEAEEELIAFVNEERAKAGVAPLIQDEAGMSVSRMIATELLNGRDPFADETDDEKKNSAYYIGKITGKNVAVNYNKIEHLYKTTNSAIAAAMFKSENYSKDLLSPEYTHIGIGIAKDEALNKSEWVINLIYYPEN